MDSPNALGAVAIYASLNMGILFWLTIQTGLIRRSERVAMGDAGNARLIRVMRGHANALEAIPMTLIALTLAALLGTSAIAIHAIGIALTAGRFLHALHFSAADAPSWQRGAGFAVSSLAMAASAILVLVRGIEAL